MFEKLIQADQELLVFFNGLHNRFFDVLMYLMTHFWFWLPMLAVVLWLMWKHYQKKLYLVLAFFALSVVITDQTSVFIKNSVQRPRPSHNVEIKDQLHLHQYKNGNVYRGGKYGFVSSHAANNFGLMVLFLYFFKPVKRRLLWIFPVWAVLSCYTRIYLGVHYPLDIVCGAFLGIFCGLLTLWFYRLSVQKIRESENENNTQP
ncbi:MAG: phosphatase PAP2 family protein [Lentimicrobiaceae bacterium]|nr:phosphatase PAP2 family protein [Lentimicrobiaceae bacterium]